MTYHIFLHCSPPTFTRQSAIFADDVIVYSEINYTPKISSKFTLWDKTWLIEFNQIKCEVLSVARKRYLVAYIQIFTAQ